MPHVNTGDSRGRGGCKINRGRAAIYSQGNYSSAYGEGGKGGRAAMRSQGVLQHLYCILSSCRRVEIDNRYTGSKPSISLSPRVRNFCSAAAFCSSACLSSICSLILLALLWHYVAFPKSFAVKMVAVSLAVQWPDASQHGP